MDDIALIFDRSHAFLGEVATRSGILQRIVLTADGERLLEAHLKDWQTRGVPVLREVPGHAGGERVYFQERVQTRDAEFVTAVRLWTDSHGLALIHVPSGVFGCWELIVRLPLEPKERFLLLVSLRNATPTDLKECNAALVQAVGAADTEREKAQKAIGQLWDRAAKTLVAQFT
jgi:hypothetical protein